MASYRDALQAFGTLAPGIGDWDAQTPCGQWTLLDLSGHVLAIARYWHALLDAVQAGRHRVDLPRGDDLADMNARDLVGLDAVAGPERMDLFLEAARAHLQRITDAEWAITLGEWEGLGPLTIGEHSGVAIGEWHVHAWDMARSIGSDHRPEDAATVAEGNRVVRDVSAQGDPWRAVLAAYGRDPDWTAPHV